MCDLHREVRVTLFDNVPISKSLTTKPRAFVEDLPLDLVDVVLLREAIASYRDYSCSRNTDTRHGHVGTRGCAHAFIHNKNMHVYLHVTYASRVFKLHEVAGLLGLPAVFLNEVSRCRAGAERSSRTGRHDNV